MIEFAVVTVSDRASSGVYEDRSGPAAVAALTEAGHRVVHTAVVPDDTTQIQQAVAQALSSGARVVLTTGGTGITRRDVTPTAVEQMCQVLVPGICEEIRRRSVPTVPTAMLSRSVAGVVEVEARRAFVLTCPGSTGGVRDSIAVLLEVADHLVAQLDDGDHPTPPDGSVGRPGPVPRPTA
ncbi:MogA/MoaB family molybdenum cofactor biosynthesis protein [Aestuariimicrobium ganziense]|uniref:MogA/MoaB family molybdenum cofactor biosynthesis protein n=1 Tax=Aestuariimicrobium ganziense TaxID=2773677 RepID=UPI001945363E|nr:MogA/MoaB family molybdenum cofactor biosynthesis protein [Aestuariimicrobium ganziense]